MDLLDEEEIEANLLGWTDDEEDNSIAIDASDEELLLQEPDVSEPPENSRKNLKTDRQSSSPKPSPVLLGPVELNDEIGLDVTLDSRDVLNTTINNDMNNEHSDDAPLTSSQIDPVDVNLGSTLKEANTEPPVAHDVSDDSKAAVNGLEEAEMIGGLINENVIKVVDSTANIDQNPKQQEKDDSNRETDYKQDVALSHPNSKSSDEVSVPTVIEVADSSVPESGTSNSVPNSSTEKSPLVDECAVTSSSETDVSVAVTGEPVVENTIKEVKEVKNEVKTAIVSPLPLNAVAPVKRVKTPSDEQRPGAKRSRCSSEPVASANVKGGPSVASTECSSSENTKIINGKKSVINFKYDNYSKNSSTNPLICKSCSMKFVDSIKFESHIIANHAMSLAISDFEIDIHKHYKLKREKVISQCRNIATKLVFLENQIDRSIISDYNANVKSVGHGPKHQYWCTICENLYSTNAIILQHLKSSKHILRRDIEK